MAYPQSEFVVHTDVCCSHTVTYEEERDDLINPRWSEDDDRCGDGEVIPIDGDEILFWESFIIKYLAPLDTNKIKQEQVRLS